MSSVTPEYVSNLYTNYISSYRQLSLMLPELDENLSPEISRDTHSKIDYLISQLDRLYGQSLKLLKDQARLKDEIRVQYEEDRETLSNLSLQFKTKVLHAEYDVLEQECVAFDGLYQEQGATVPLVTKAAALADKARALYLKVCDCPNQNEASNLLKPLTERQVQMQEIVRPFLLGPEKQPPLPPVVDEPAQQEEDDFQSKYDLIMSEFEKLDSDALDHQQCARLLPQVNDLIRQSEGLLNLCLEENKDVDQLLTQIGKLNDFKAILEKGAVPNQFQEAEMYRAKATKQDYITLKLSLEELIDETIGFDPDQPKKALPITPAKFDAVMKQVDAGILKGEKMITVLQDGHQIETMKLIVKQLNTLKPYLKPGIQTSPGTLYKELGDDICNLFISLNWSEAAPRNILMNSEDYQEARSKIETLIDRAQALTTRVLDPSTQNNLGEEIVRLKKLLDCLQSTASFVTLLNDGTVKGYEVLKKALDEMDAYVVKKGVKNDLFLSRVQELRPFAEEVAMILAEQSHPDFENIFVIQDRLAAMEKAAEMEMKKASSSSVEAAHQAFSKELKALQAVVAEIKNDPERALIFTEKEQKSFNELKTKLNALVQKLPVASPLRAVLAQDEAAVKEMEAFSNV